MPLYEYACRACGHQFEVLQRMGEGADGLACTACGDDGIERQLSTFASCSDGSGGSAAPACGGGSGFT